MPCMPDTYFLKLPVGFQRGKKAPELSTLKDLALYLWDKLISFLGFFPFKLKTNYDEGE